MGLINFIKSAGEKLLGLAGGSKEEALSEDALESHVKGMRFDVDNLDIKVNGDTVSVSGSVDEQSVAEKIALTLGNVKGVGAVQNNIKVKVQAPEATYHTVKKGEYLSLISKKYYKDAMKYNLIFEANKPMLKHPDKIYPGQVLRIPPIN